MQVLVLASDGGSPPLTDTATIEVRVQRNLRAPSMREDEYVTKIRETQPLGVDFVRIDATDADNQSPYRDVSFRMVGDDVAREFFDVDAESGQVVVVKDLRDDATKRLRYEVRIL